ncbi:MAG: hypothetical protein K2K93_01850, partial [Muribaculaceae bacterium]|nr:hypothetical protein [Muribaculaceae bacterium]
NISIPPMEQTVAYYPYGGVIADLGTNLSKQQYKFGGKELLTAGVMKTYAFSEINNNWDLYEICKSVKTTKKSVTVCYTCHLYGIMQMGGQTFLC